MFLCHSEIPTLTRFVYFSFWFKIPLSTLVFFLGQFVPLVHAPKPTKNRIILLNKFSFMQLYSVAMSFTNTKVKW